MSRARKLGPEASLLRAVCDLLTAERIWWMRCNTGTQVLEHNGRKRAFRAGKVGMADLLAFAAPRAICDGCGFERGAACDEPPACEKSWHVLCVPTWIELKSPRGVQSPAQKAFQAEVEGEGHVYLLIRDVSELQRWLKERA